MSITAYTGLQGHGKSHGVVEYVILPALKAGRVVFTNIPMNSELLIKDFGSDVVYFTIDEIKDNPKWFDDVFIAGAIFVCDELWKLWPTGTRATAVPPSHLSFLAEHRHMVCESGFSSEIIFVTQDLSQIASFARTLVESTFRVQKLIKLGSTKKFRVDIYFGSVTGANPPVSKRERSIFGKFKEPVYKYYTSHTKSVAGLSGDDTKIDGRTNLLKRPIFIVLPIVFLIIIVLVYNYFPSFSGLSGSDPVVKSNPKPVNSKGEPVAFTSSPVKKVIIKPPFLSNSSSIIITLNPGNYSGALYRFRVLFDNHYSVLHSSDFERLGYSVSPVADCLVLIKGFDYNGYVMCEDEDADGWLDSAVNTTASTN